MKLQSRWLGHSVLAVLVGVSAIALADQAPATLARIVVTATRTAQTEDATLAPVTVITRREIEQLQPASLPALLNDTPGMSVVNEGGPGANTSLFLRGTNSDHVLVLVDGVRIGSATVGAAPLNDIPVDQIQRIEIVRGPFSSLYGSGAIGGVIQVFLRHTPGAFVPNAVVGVGSYDHWKAGAGFSAASEKGWLSLQASHEQTQGIHGCRNGAAELGVACFVDQPQRRDGFHNRALTVHGAYQFNDRWSVDGLGMRSEGFDKFDGDALGGDRDRYATQVVGGQLHFQASSKLQLTLRAGQSADFERDFFENTNLDFVDTRRSLGSLQANLALVGGLLSTGVDWQRDHVLGSIAYAVATRTNRGLFAEWQRSFGPQSLQLSVRRDSNTQFGGATTGSALWGWNFARHLRVTASYGTAYHAPTFNDLYFPGFGNPNLKPERSRNLDLGLRGTPGWGNWSVDVYRDQVRQLIATNAVFIPENIDRAQITGLEGSVGGTLLGWQVRATATLLNARDDEPGGLDEGRKLPRRPRQFARFDVNRRFGRFHFGASWHLNGYAYDDLANTHRMGGYSLVNLRAGWQINHAWILQLALNNVFDKDYETAYFYNQPGRNYMLTLRWQPGARSVGRASL